MITVRARTSALLDALSTPWGAVTIWLLLLFSRQLVVAVDLLRVSETAPFSFHAGLLAATGAAVILVVVLRGLRVGYGPWDSRLSLIGAALYGAAEVLARWPISSLW